jgi:hypothetical protein
MKKFKLIFLAIFVAVCAVSLVGCAGFGKWNTQAQKDIDQLKKDLAPLIADAQKGIAFIQNDYGFFSAVVQGGLQVVGVKVTQADIDAIKPYIAAADANLAVLGAAVNNQPVTTAAVQNAVTATSNAIPALKTQVLQNPAVSALYNLYLTGKTNLAPPASPPSPAPVSG